MIRKNDAYKKNYMFLSKNLYSLVIIKMKEFLK